MTTTGASRAVLFANIQAQWQASEVALRQCEDAFAAPASDRWSVGDIFRHLVGLAHRLAPDMLAQIFASGTIAAADRDRLNAEEIAKFTTLTPRSLQIELSTAHATVWMFLQRYAEADLARPITTSLGTDLAFGELLDRLCRQHERDHVETARQAAGSKLKTPVPFHSWS